MITAFAFASQGSPASPAQINPAGPPGRSGQDGAPGPQGPAGAIQDISGKANLGHTSVNNTNYQVLVSDVDVAFVALTAPRTVKLCDVDSYPLGQDLVIGDESGSCSAMNTITILVGDGSSDTIPQQSDGTIVLAYAFASVRLRRGAANIWKIV
jgi:hypothetical protein